MYILHLGISGFPFGNAPVQRILLTFRSLKLSGLSPLIINKQSVYRNKHVKRVNHYMGVPYIMTSCSIDRPDSYILRNLNKLSGLIGELILLFRKRKSIKTAIYYNASFFELVYYRILSKLFKFKLIIQYVELRSVVKHRQSTFTHLNDLLFDNYCFRFCDAIIVISEYLYNRAIAKNNSLPVIKIPSICDFDEFENRNNVSYSKYIMYCGSITYLPVIEFVIRLFDKLKSGNIYQGSLLLAIGSGIDESDGFSRLEDSIRNCQFSQDIILRKNVLRNELIKLYQGSELLIVPLQNTLQDIAGFHHKIGEYAAARKPIISTRIGEVKNYFMDGESAILADEYSLESYVAKIKEALSDSVNVERIGINGFYIGQEKLNYKAYSNTLRDFILELG